MTTTYRSIPSEYIRTSDAIYELIYKEDKTYKSL